MAIIPKMQRKGAVITDVNRKKQEINYISRNGKIIFHKHEGSSETGGGCYTKPVYHVHNENCYKESVCGGQLYCVYGSHYVHGCRKCGGTIANYMYAEESATVGADCNSHYGGKCYSVVKNLICGKTETDVDYYLPACVYSEDSEPIQPWFLTFKDYPLSVTSTGSNATQQCYTGDYYQISCKKTEGSVAYGGVYTSTPAIPTKGCNKVRIKYSASHFDTSQGIGYIMNTKISAANKSGTLVLDISGDTFTLSMSVTDATAYFNATIKITEVYFYYE